MIDTSRYPARVFWSDEDEGFIAEAIDLPGCSAFGETQSEAIIELQNAIKAWIAAGDCGRERDSAAATQGRLKAI